MFDPNTGTSTTLVDDNGVPMIAGTPKAPTPTHYSGRYPGADGFYHVYNTTTAQDVTLPTRVPPKVAAQGSWQKIEDPVTHKISFYNPTTQETKDTPFKGAAQTASHGDVVDARPGQNGKYWRINSVTNERRLIPGYHPQASGAVGTYSTYEKPGRQVLWRINSVTNKIVKTNIPWPTSAHGAAVGGGDTELHRRGSTPSSGRC